MNVIQEVPREIHEGNHVSRMERRWDMHVARKAPHGKESATWQGKRHMARELPHGMHPSDSRDAPCITDTPNWFEWVSQVRGT